MVFNNICLLALVRLLCFLVIHYKNNANIATESRIVLDDIRKIRSHLYVHCTQDSVFGVYCKTQIDKLDDEANILYYTNQNEDYMNIGNIETAKMSYYGIYRDHILFA